MGEEDWPRERVCRQKCPCDYTQEDFTSNGRTYDLIRDLAGHRSEFAYRGSLMPGGRYLYVGGSVATLLQVC